MDNIYMEIIDGKIFTHADTSNKLYEDLMLFGNAVTKNIDGKIFRVPPEEWGSENEMIYKYEA